MTISLLPLEYRPNIKDLSRFQNFAVPRRRLTPRERAVYEELAAEWAVLEARAQKVLYAQLIDGRLAEAVDAIVTETATTIYTRQDRIRDPRVAALAKRTSEAVLQEHFGHVMGFYRTGAAQAAEQLATDMTSSPAARNFWQRMLGRGSHE